MGEFWTAVSAVTAAVMIHGSVTDEQPSAKGDGYCDTQIAIKRDEEHCQIANKSKED